MLDIWIVESSLLLRQPEYIIFSWFKIWRPKPNTNLIALIANLIKYSANKPWYYLKLPEYGICLSVSYSFPTITVLFSFVCFFRSILWYAGSLLLQLYKFLIPSTYILAKVRFCYFSKTGSSLIRVGNPIHLLNFKVTYLKFRNLCCWKSHSGLVFFYLAQLLYTNQLFSTH